MAWQVPWVRRRAGPAGLLVLMLGAVLPLLDPLRFSIVSEDQIAFLTQDPMFSGPLSGLALAALAAAIAFALGMPARRCLGWWGWAAAGILPPPLLASFTPGGAAWLAPYLAHRYSWPILPEDHIWLIGILGTALVIVELWPRRKRWVLGIAAGLVFLEAAIGLAGQLGLGTHIASTPNSTREIEPDGLWPGRWLEVVVSPERYVAVTRGLGSAGDQPSVTPRWNDQVRLLRLLEDPILRRFYFEVFRHPVATVETSDSKIRLTVRELADAIVGAKGATLVFETDAHGRHRQYLVERLD